MTASESEPERLEIDTETWSKRDLIQVISSRYFVLGEVESGEYSWRVNGIDGKSVSECLLDMNSHLEKLGMIGLCLLYTSPSPRDVEESRMPSSA